MCKRSGKRIHHNGDGLGNSPGELHCIACLVTWRDSDHALCYVCAEPFRCEGDGRHGQAIYTGRCYHMNQIKRPCCEGCEKIVGGVLLKHGRRQLRRIVGLR